MFYVCIATQEDPPRIMYPEHFIDKSERDKRSAQLKYECYNHDGAIWYLYEGEECIESAIARGKAQMIEGETEEDCQTRIDALCLKSAKSSKSVLTEPEIDNTPEWFKQGYSSQSEMDLYTKGRKK